MADGNDVKSDDENDSNFVIEMFNLTKKYKIRGSNKDIIALNNVNLKIKEGEIFGLLGPNGAGKTTMVSILTTLIQPTAGYATILGRNILKQPKFVKENVGLMLGGDMIYYRLSGYRNLKFFCKIYNIRDYKERIKNVAERLGLQDWLNQYVENYSTGMKVKLALARVLIIDPKILFLDEPMLGLDPKSVRSIIKILLDFKKTIFLTSHQMNVVQSICDRIAFLKQGSIIKVDTQENFKKVVTDKIKIQVQVEKAKVIPLIDALSILNFVGNIEKTNNTINFNLNKKESYPDLFEILKNYPISKFKEIESSLEDVFIKLSS